MDSFQRSPRLKLTTTQKKREWRRLGRKSDDKIDYISSPETEMTKGNNEMKIFDLLARDVEKW